MKTSRRIIATVLSCFLLCYVVPGNSQAAFSLVDKDSTQLTKSANELGNNPTNFEQPFFDSDFIYLCSHSDGANSYALEDMILEFFSENPNKFLVELSRLNGETRNTIKTLLVTATYHRELDFEQFKNTLATVDDEVSFLMAQEILNYAEEYEASELEWEEFYNDWINSPIPDGLFDSDQLIKAVKLWENSYPFDGEYCNYIYHLYLLDSNLFAQTISELSPDAQNLILAQLAYMQLDYPATVSKFAGGTVGQPLSKEALDVNGLIMLDKLGEVKVSPKIVLEKALQIDEASLSFSYPPREISLQNTLNPSSIKTILYTPEKICVWQTVTCTVSLNSLSANTQYSVEVWVRHDGETDIWKKGVVRVTTNSSGAATANLEMAFSEPGDIWTTVKIYKGSTLIAERTGAAPDYIIGRWSIKLPLDSNHKGTLIMLDTYGKQVYACAALGQSASGAHYTEYLGNTPPGDYYGWPGGPASDTGAYGPNKYIYMEPKYSL